MLDIVKECVGDKVKQWNEKYVKPQKSMDLIQELAQLFMKIILTCTFGEDISEHTLDYYENGVKTTKPVSFVLRETFHK